MKHLMLDLETLSLSNRAAMMSCGIAIYDPEGEGITYSRCWNLNLDDVMRHGGELDDGTLRFWLKAESEARLALMTPAPLYVAEVLSQIIAKWNEYDCEAVWSHGAIFDIPIIEHYYRSYGMKPPWTYRQARDTRTLFDLATRLGWVIEPRDPAITAHNAENDARMQVMEAQAAWKWITACERPDQNSESDFGPSLGT